MGAVTGVLVWPLLGLTLAHRMTELLGGELRIESPGRSVCRYRLALHAESSEDAVWIDPTGDGGHLGPVRPGRVLFVGSSRTRCLNIDTRLVSVAMAHRQLQQQAEIR